MFFYIKLICLFKLIMGTTLFDKYSLLHFSTGVIARFYHISFIHWFILHLIFEYFENIPQIVLILNKLNWWPGGKQHSDTLINNIGDQFSAMLGWYIADILEIKIN